ncbi:MAG: Cupredoxin-like domain [Deinococcota bacterium]|jgi:plastocyanin
MKRIIGIILGTTALLGCNNPTILPVNTTCPSTIEISGSANAYLTTSCTLKVGTPITIQARTGHPLSGSGAGQTKTGATTDQVIAFANAGTFNFQCDFHGVGGMKGSITIVQ